MDRLAQLAARLTPSHHKEVEDFAEFLLARQVSGPAAAVVERDGEFYLDVDKVAGMFAGMAPDRTDVELQHEALALRASED